MGRHSNIIIYIQIAQTYIMNRKKEAISWNIPNKSCRIPFYKNREEYVFDWLRSWSLKLLKTLRMHILQVYVPLPQAIYRGDLKNRGNLRNSLVWLDYET